MKKLRIGIIDLVARGPTRALFARLGDQREVRRPLGTDRPLRRDFEPEADELPAFFVDQVRGDPGPLSRWLPTGALHHEPHAHLKSEQAKPRRAGAAAPAEMIDA